MIYSLAKQKKAGYEIFWLGDSDRKTIFELEEKLNMNLPISFKKFLGKYGGGGVVGSEISGIEDNDIESDVGGTVYGDTKTCRLQHGLPHNIAVVYFHDDEVYWCLDTNSYSNEECPVVSYNLFTQKVDRTISSDFASFLCQHLALYK